MLAISMPIPLLGSMEGGQEAMVSASLILKEGGLGSWSPSSHIEREGGQVAMTSASSRRKEGRRPWSLPLSS